MDRLARWVFSTAQPAREDPRHLRGIRHVWLVVSRAGSRRLLTLTAAMLAGPGAPVDGSPKLRTFAGYPRQARRARQFVARVLNGSPFMDTAVLLTSELVTNALAYSASAGESFEVIIWRDAAAVLVAVIDDGSDANPAVVAVDPDTESGRGLGLVDALADCWGHAGGVSGRAVWFLLREHD